MKRIVFICTLGFIFGIIMGLYYNIAPFFILTIVVMIYLMRLFKTKLSKNFTRILKIFIKNKMVLMFSLFAVISFIYLKSIDAEYKNIYNSFSKGEIVGTIVSIPKETEYKRVYKIRAESFNNKKIRNKLFLLQLPKTVEVKYANKIRGYASYSMPEDSRNYKGFDYSKYLKTQKIYGTFSANNLEIVKENNVNIIECSSNKIKQIIIKNTDILFPDDTKEIFLSILIGYKDNLQEELRENFSNSSLSHILAISGAHISYIIMGLTFILYRIKITKKMASIVICIFLIFFMYITDFTASVLRATISGIILLAQILVNRKQDTLTTMNTTLLIILINNPYRILDIGLLLSYFATIGIVVCGKLIKNKQEKSLLIIVKQVIFITIFANIFVIPIIAYDFNTISLSFIISNLIAGILMGPITIIGFVVILLSFVNIKLSAIIVVAYNFLLKILIFTAKTIGTLNISKIVISTPSILSVIVYYISIFINIFNLIVRDNKSKRYLVKRINAIIKLLINFINRKIKCIIIIIFVIIIIFSILSKIPKNLKIYFIDVGQGDSSLIITPTDKKILIDSGGSESESFDIGKSTLVPYLLDRKIKKLDYICISHFDSDHCKGFIYLLNNIKVKNILISKQYEETENFTNIIEIAKEKRINIIVLKEKQIFKIDKYIKFNILNPSENLKPDINDNSLVIKLEYLNFSCLFTGDISKNIEEELCNKYKKYLKSDILKVAHHGSTTSSCEKFINLVRPKVSLIGVGKDNKFNHPHDEVVQRLKNINSKIYRTDLNGEIEIDVSKKRKNLDR